MRAWFKAFQDIPNPTANRQQGFPKNIRWLPFACAAYFEWSRNGSKKFWHRRLTARDRPDESVHVSATAIDKDAECSRGPEFLCNTIRHQQGPKALVRLELFLRAAGHPDVRCETAADLFSAVPLPSIMPPSQIRSA